MAQTFVRPSQINGVPVGFLVPPVISDGTETLISNSAVETTLFTQLIAASMLGTKAMLGVRLWCRFQNNTGGAQTTTFRFKYGGTTLISLGLQTASLASDYAPYLDFMLRGDGATNAQKAQGIIMAGGVGGAGAAPLAIFQIGTSAIDSTLAQTLLITAQLGAASVNYTLTSRGVPLQGPF